MALQSCWLCFVIFVLDDRVNYYIERGYPFTAEGGFPYDFVSIMQYESEPLQEGVVTISVRTIPYSINEEQALYKTRNLGRRPNGSSPLSRQDL